MCIHHLKIIILKENFIKRVEPMKSKYLVLLTVCILVSIWCVQAQDIVTKGRFTNSVYAFETPLLGGTDDSETHVFLFQYLRFQARMKELNHLTFNLDTRVLTDLQEEIDEDLRYRINRISLSAQDLFSGYLDLEVGRIFYHPGITFGSLDGANLTLKPIRNLQIQLYGGIESHLLRSYKMNELDDVAVYGGSLKFINCYQTDWQLSYLQKTHASEIQWQIVGLNASHYAFSAWKFLLQAHYDIANSRLHRLYFSTRFSPSKKLYINVNLKQQHPQVYADSYFNIFDLEEYRQAGLCGTYYLTDNYSVTANYQLFMLEEGQGHRFIASVNNNNGSVGVVYETGDLGDQLGFLINYGYEFIPGLIGSVSIDYMRYRFEEIYAYENQLANALRLTYAYSKHWKTDLEYQLLNNKFKDTDHRVLNHIHFIW
jgi:hypothetical protein